ncbi:MAG: DUF5060 domain-containing protein, partial [Phycisphaerae bacterium]
MKNYRYILLLAMCFILIAEDNIFGVAPAPDISGEMKKWHKITLTFDGPQTSEDAEPNPFLDYRLNVTFAKDEKQHTVPGYYAADGNAAETSATTGNKWRVHFVPDEVGRWTYTVYFRTGPDIALSNDPTAGSPIIFNGAKGTFTIGPSDKSGRDFRGKGLLKYVGKRYLQFAETGKYFLKGGADSPENFLAYAEFDDTHDTGERIREGEAVIGEFLHRYTPHLHDWQPGDPTWQNAKGKGVIGALNYLASKGMNSVYFITY